MKKLVFLMLPMMMFMASCGAQSTEGDVTVAEAQEMIKDENVVILDVRTPEEFEKGHLEGATMINFFDEDFDKKIAELPKDKEYLVYCHSGNRSGKAVKKMEAAGFTNAHNMAGGWSSWSAEVKNKK